MQFNTYWDADDQRWKSRSIEEQREQNKSDEEELEELWDLYDLHKDLYENREGWEEVFRDTIDRLISALEAEGEAEDNEQEVQEIRSEI